MSHWRYPRRRITSAQTICIGIRTVIALFLGVSAPTILEAQSVVKASTGSIQGIIIDSNHNPVIGAKVWAMRVFSAAPVTAPPVTSTDTDINGAYQFSGLAPASYRVCVYAETVMLLDPCSWSNHPPLSNLDSGQATTLNIILATGQFVHVRVDDPKGAIASAEQRTGALAIVMSGVTADGHGTYFAQVATDSAGRNFRALVPSGVAVSIKVGSPLKVVNQGGDSVLTAPPSVQGSIGDQAVKLTVQ